MERIFRALTICRGWHHPTRHPRVFETDSRAVRIAFYIKHAADVGVGVKMLGMKAVLRIDVRE